MKRYQVYLNSESVEILDRFEEETSISRSALIREAIDRLSENLEKALITQGFESKRRVKLKALVGAVRLGKAPTQFARMPDRKYLGR